jgi:hypothetical protein
MEQRAHFKICKQLLEYKDLLLLRATWGLYHEALQICNLWKMDRFRSKLVSFGLDKHTSFKDPCLLWIPYITNLSCFYDTGPRW